MRVGFRVQGCGVYALSERGGGPLPALRVDAPAHSCASRRGRSLGACMPTCPPSTLNPQPGVLTADALEAQRPQQKRTAFGASMLPPLHCQRR